MSETKPEIKSESIDGKYHIRTSRGAINVEIKDKKAILTEDSVKILRQFFGFVDYSLTINEYGYFLILDLSDSHDGQPEYCLLEGAVDDVE